MSLRRKFMLGLARNVQCEHCAKVVGISRWDALAMLPIFLAIALAPLFFARAVSYTVAAVFLCVYVLVHLYGIPLVRRGGT